LANGNGSSDKYLDCSGPNGTCTYTLLEPLPGNNFPSQVGDEVQFYAYINGILWIVIVLGAMIAVARIAIGGVQIMVSDVAGTRSQAKTTIWAMIWGLVLLVTSVLILRTVNPNLVNLNIINDLKSLGCLANPYSTDCIVLKGGT
jgi:uncharacterized protein (DUF983 family)